MEDVKDRWWRLFDQAPLSPLYNSIASEPGPKSDWAGDSGSKVDDFVRALVASFALLERYQPFSTVETGVFSGGTSAVFLKALPRGEDGSAIHLGIDPYFAPDQSYRNAKAHGYNAVSYLNALRDLSTIAHRHGTPYVPYLMSSQTFIAHDLLPSSHDFRIFHLDGEHSLSAVEEELTYFSGKARGPCVFILDDIGPMFPGVLQAAENLRLKRGSFHELARFFYDSRYLSDQIGFAVFHLDK
jgi:hypothetical protein